MADGLTQRTPVHRPASPAGSDLSRFTPSVASSYLTASRRPGAAEGLEEQLAVLKGLHASGLLDAEVFARQQDALLTQWRRSSQPPSVFEGDASIELDSHCERLRAALEQRLTTAKSRQLDYAASREAAAQVEAAVDAEAIAHRKAISGAFREAGDAMLAKEQELTEELEARREHVVHSLSAQQEELVDSLAQHLESVALLHAALREEDTHSFHAGHAQLCARLETEEALAEALYEARTTTPHQLSRWSIPDGLVPGTAGAAIAAASAIGFDRWAPPPAPAAEQQPPQRQEAPPTIHYSGMEDPAEAMAPVSAQEDEEAEVYRLAAEGDAESQYILGGWLSQGRALSGDAETQYRVAAEQGHAEAACALGCLLIEPLAAAAADGGNAGDVGKGSAAAVEALALLQQAADAGVLEAHFNLGWVNSSGLLGEDDYEKAADHYRVAAHGGDAGAMLQLGNLLADTATPGSDGMLEAIEWWKKAAEESEATAEAAYRLGQACLREAESLQRQDGGEDDARLVEAGKAQALQYYQRAEAAGSADAAAAARQLRMY